MITSLSGDAPKPVANPTVTSHGGVMTADPVLQIDSYFIDPAVVDPAWMSTKVPDPFSPVDIQPKYVTFEPINPYVNDNGTPDLNAVPDLSLASQTPIQPPAVTLPESPVTTDGNVDAPIPSNSGAINLLTALLIIAGMVVIVKGKVF